MKINYSILLLFSLALAAHGQDMVGTKTSHIPDNWILFEEAAGDLNKDGLDDLALVIENTIPNLEGARDRALLILFKNNKADDTYTLIARGDDVITGSTSGGAAGDPFARMVIKKNVLCIDFAGGSREPWTTTHRYRYLNYFALVGATYKAASGRVKEFYDYNLDTGKIVARKKGAENKAGNFKRKFVHKIMRPELSGFAPEAIWAILMPQRYAKVSACVLQEVAVGDCAHVIFDCGDFGNADPYLDEASQALWNDLALELETGEVGVNSKYEGKTFEITYAEKTGTRCAEEGEATYHLLVGFRLKN